MGEKKQKVPIQKPMPSSVDVFEKSAIKSFYIFKKKNKLTPSR